MIDARSGMPIEPIYLSIDQVIELHAEAIEQFGGADGLRSIELLESAVFQPQQSAFGEDAYPSFAAKAAAYAYFLTANHPFVDGNKRTAAAAMLAFLYLNGFRLDQSDRAIEDTIVGVAAKTIAKDEFFRWVADAIDPRTGSRLFFPV